MVVAVVALPSRGWAPARIPGSSCAGSRRLARRPGNAPECPRVPQGAPECHYPCHEDCLTQSFREIPYGPEARVAGACQRNETLTITVSSRSSSSSSSGGGGGSSSSSNIGSTSIVITSINIIIGMTSVYIRGQSPS